MQATKIDPLPQISKRSTFAKLILVVFVLGGVMHVSAFSAMAQEQAQEQKTDEANPPQQPAKPDPQQLQNLFNGLKKVVPGIQLLPGFGNNNPVQNAEGQGNKGDSRLKMDPNAPVDAQQSLLWRKTLREVQTQDWKQAQELLQFILDSPEGGLIQTFEGKLSPLRLEAQKLIRQFPQENQDQLRLQYEGFSQKKLDEAQREGSLQKFHEIAHRFLFTPAGQEAANFVGMYYFDRGRFGLAAYWFDWLQELNAPLTRRTTWQLKAALAYSAAGKEKRYKQLLKQIETEEPERFQELSSSFENWSKQLTRQNGNQTAETEWLMAMGNASRNGFANGGDPLLKSRWKVPLTFNLQLNSQLQKGIENYLEDYSPEVSLVGMAQFPLMVRGFAVFKTLKGLAVIEAESGKLQWETNDSFAPENLSPVSRFDNQFERNFFRQAGPASGSNIDPNLMTQLLFSNYTYGSFSSDGKRVYVLESHSLTSSGQTRAWQRRNQKLNDRISRQLSSNKLVSYDLKTGRPVWEVGGMELYESFGLPLTGYYFHGAPVADQGELLVVAEKNDELRLLSLDPETGIENWSRLIAFSDSKIEQDDLRRQWGNLIATSEGVLVSPTGTGWLVAIDRMTHAVLWAQKYSQSDETERGEVFFRNRFNEYADPEMLGKQISLPPVISQNCVLYSPPDGESIHCYDLQTGKRLWKKPPSSGLYFAGVYQDLVLVVESSRLVAYDLQTGHRKWQCQYSKYNPEIGTPCGIGVATEDRYYLPFRSGQLWSVELKTGKRSSALYVPQAEGTLGNLTMYQGRLFSLNSHGLTCFEQRDFVEEEITKRLADNPEDAWGLLRKTEMATLERRFESALENLKIIDVNSLNSQLTIVYYQQLRQILQVCAHAPQEFTNLNDLDWGIQQLKKRYENGELVDSASNREADWLLVSQVEISRAILKGDFLNAFQAALKLVPQLQANPSRLVKLNDRWRTEQRLALWLADQLRTIWGKADSETQNLLEKELNQFLVHVGRDDLVTNELMSRLFEFHASGSELKKELAMLYQNRGDWLHAAEIWKELIESAKTESPEMGLLAHESLIGLWEANGLTQDAELFSLQSVSTEHDKPNSLLLKLQQKYRSPSAWNLENLQLMPESVGYIYNRNFNSSPRYFADSETYYFRNRRVQMRNNHRLGISLLGRDEYEWLVPLRGTAPDQTPPVFTTGHILIVPHGNVIHALSPVDRRVLWTKEVELDPYADMGYYEDTSEKGHMLKGRAALNSEILSHQLSSQSPVVYCDGGYVVVRGRRRLEVLDVISGETQWTLPQLSGFAQVMGNAEYLVLIEERPDRVEQQVFLTPNGSPVELNADLFNTTIHLAKKDFVTISYEKRKSLESESAEQKRSVYSHLIQSLNPLTNEVSWKQEFPGGTRLARVSRSRIVAVSPQGDISELDLNNGNLFQYQLPGKMDFYKAPELKVFSSGTELFFVVNRRGWGNDNNRFYSGDFSFVEVKGHILCLDRVSGKLKWEQEVQNNNLILESLNESPFLTLMSTELETQQNSDLQKVTIMALDRETGNKILQSQFYMVDFFEGFSVNHTDQMVRLSSTTQRFLLTTKSPAVVQIGVEEPEADQKAAE